MILEINSAFAPTQEHLGLISENIMVTPAIGDKDYWLYRVKVSNDQAIIGFPKFRTIGIGFEKEDTEEDTNLPYTCNTRTIFNHIKKNKGDDSIPDSSCIQAIQMIQEASTKYRVIPEKITDPEEVTDLEDSEEEEEDTL